MRIFPTTTPIEDDEIITPRCLWLSVVLTFLVPPLASLGIGLCFVIYVGNSVVTRIAASVLAVLLYFGLFWFSSYVDRRWLEKRSRKADSSVRV